MKFRSSMEQDYPTIARWIEEDIFHHGKMTADWWIPNPDKTGGYFICVEDDKGPVIFLRIDKEDDLFRFHMQFAPEDEVSKLRTAKTLLKIFDPLVDEFRKQGGKGIIFKSTNDPLIKFMIKKGFQPSSEDDYLLPLEGVFCADPQLAKKALATNEASFASTLAANYGQQFQNQNNILTALNQSLSPTVAAGPSQQGWSPAEAAAVNTNILNTTSANYQNAQRSAQTALAGRGGGAANANIAASGIDSQIGASFASQAAGQTSTEENQAIQANYAQGNKNYNTALGAEEGVAQTYDPSSYGGLALKGQGQAFGEADTVAQEQAQEESDIASGITGLASKALTGGFGKNIGNFLGGK